mmetsp:Transcript_6265/g.9717  ORF Transcript_6265/g.9717 Transcript_6265/m.9717 type:complete len:724 (+) Transcript_6265:114-2285(+)
MMTSPLVLRLLACASLASAASSSSTSAKTTPQRIIYTGLSSAADDSGSDLLLDALTKDGYVSITDIRSQHGLHFREMKRNLMSNLHECLSDIGEDVPLQHLDDGTVRKSFATVTLPSADDAASQQPIHLLDDYLARNPHKSAACHAFQEHLSDFRSTVGDATRLFAARLSVELGVALPSPLLLSSNVKRGTDNYDDVESVVMGSEHLEHFHSYQKGDDVKEGNDSMATIELHTDQGLFIAFTPGMFADHSTDQSRMELSDGFYVQDSTTGENVLLEFTQDDDLVFMLGDGVNQIINNQLGDEDGKKVLRATPHALSLSNEQPRVWYGRMVLAPNDAYLPEAASTTFGQLRQVFVESSSKGESIPMGIGCSSNSKMVINTSRFLADEEHDEDEGGHGVSENQCADDSMFCWYRCMALTEETATCAERRLGLQCVDPRGLVVEGGAGHGDFYPACTNNTHITHPITPYPQIEQQDTDVCTADLWTEFNAEEEYDHVISLKPDPTKPGPDTNLYWSIIESEDGQKKLKARLTFNDVFGWLAMGFANEFDTVHNGMNGGKVLLMKPGGEYSPVTGLDLSVGPNVGAYVIDDTDSAFRHWVDTESAVEKASHEHTDCFTALSFESDNISGQTFNLEGTTDDIIWAGNSNDYYVGYHSPFSRARLTINWLTGDVEFFVSKPAWGAEDDADVSEADPLDSPTKLEDDDSSSSTIGAPIGLAIVIISIMML